MPSRNPISASPAIALNTCAILEPCYAMTSTDLEICSRCPFCLKCPPSHHSLSKLFLSFNSHLKCQTLQQASLHSTNLMLPFPSLYPKSTMGNQMLLETPTSPFSKGKRACVLVTLAVLSKVPWPGQEVKKDFQGRTGLGFQGWWRSPNPALWNFKLENRDSERLSDSFLIIGS